jgi:hypothetical protein
MSCETKETTALTIDDNGGVNISLTDLLLDMDTTPTEEQELRLIAAAKVLGSLPVPLELLYPMSSDIFTKLAATMRQAWNGRPMPPAVAVFVKCMDSPQ